jgi:hypothetical protein
LWDHIAYRDAKVVVALRFSLRRFRNIAAWSTARADVALHQDTVVRKFLKQAAAVLPHGQ